MNNGHFDTISRAAAVLAETDGLRAGCTAIIEPVSRAVTGKFAFIALAEVDASVADIIAAHGLGAADFRRLEVRVTKSSLWRILNMAAPVAIDDLSKDDALSHLAYGTGARLLIAVPIVSRGSAAGLLAVGFDARTRPGEDEVIKFLKVIASLVAQTMRVESVSSAEGRRLADENTSLKQALKQKYDFGQLIGNSSPMRRVYDQAKQVARTNTSVLLRGETGTGKELIANAIHYNSLRSKRPFVKVNCASLPEGLVDDELFGSGPPSKRKKGRFELADGGTIFVDEIGDLPLATQTQVLGIVNDGWFDRPGAEKTRVNVRLIAASGKELEHAVAQGSFSEELFHRLNSFTIFLPPLRERKSDILLLAEHFVEKYGREQRKQILRISTPAIDMLTAYHFPGNVRELENVVERAVAACDSNVIHGRHLPPTLQTAEVSDTETRLTLASAVEAFERDLIQDALKSTRGNITQAAKMLDSTERILGYKINKYGVNARRFRR